MPILTSRAPSPPLAEHPEFAVMLVVTLEHFHCTLGEVREDYWLGRVWRALTGDPVLAGRVARAGVSNVLLTGAEHGAPPAGLKERERLILHAHDRIAADTGRQMDSLGVALRWSEGPVTVTTAPVLSLLAQVVVDDPRWKDLEWYVGDLGAVQVPVAYTAEAVVAA
ncbi:MAG: hypothetical protein Q8Q85_06185 [Gemmatimonadales bacterium]|nr:hypothetical protein [Gemmatimonadales bacterium]